MKIEIVEDLKEFNRIYKEENDLYHSLSIKLGLSDCAMWILYAMYLYERPCTQKEICDAWSYPKQTVHSALKKLQQDGYVGIEVDTLSRRNRLVSFTDEGSKYADRIVRPIIEAEIRAMGALEDQEREALIGVYGKYLGFLRAETEKIKEKSNE